MSFRKISARIFFLTLLATISVASERGDDGWMGRVPQSDHEQKSPLRKKGNAIAEGHKTYRAHCAQCHGENAKGSDRAPTLVSSRVKHQATDGDLHWLLVNGNKERGMPAWAKLGDPQIWQIISYLRSLR